jgi:hypothetical protein
MTPYIFQPTTTDQFVDWSDPAVWIGGAIPDVPSAEVVIQAVAPSGGGTDTAFISVASDESYSVDSVQLASNFLTIDGVLTVAADFALQAGGAIDVEGGTLDAGTLENNGSDIQGYGQVTTTGVLTNNSEIVGEDLTLTLGGLVNGGTLVAVFGNLVVQVPSGFAQFSDGGLTGGAYIAGYAGNTAANSNTLYFNIGGVVTTDSAAITLNSGGAIDSFDSASSSYVSIQSTLNLVSAPGSLSLAGQSYDWETALTVAGSLSLLGGATDFNGQELIVDPGGTVNGAGIIEGPVANSGAILAGLPADPAFGSVGGKLNIQGAVTGVGTIKINATSTLDLGGPDSGDVSFADGTGTLQLDDLSAFSGTITLGGPGDQIILEGISYASVTGYTYAGSAAGGALTIDAAGTAYSLNFNGDFDTASFALSAGPQLFTSSPPSLLITRRGPDTLLWQNVDGQASIWEMDGNTRIGGGPAGAINPGPSWKAVGTGDFNHDGNADILWQNTNGQASIWEMDGTTKIGGGPAGSVNPGPSWKAVGTGDFNHDGNSDILWQNTVSGQVSIWEMDGTTKIGGGPVANLGPSWKAVGTGDFNHDGNSDILWQNTVSGQVSIWEMDGTTKIGGGPVANRGTSWQAIGASGSDILWQNTSGQTAIWDMDGNARIGGGAVSPNPGPSWHAIGLA